MKKSAHRSSRLMPALAVLTAVAVAGGLFTLEASGILPMQGQSMPMYHGAAKSERKAVKSASKLSRKSVRSASKASKSSAKSVRKASRSKRSRSAASSAR